MNTDDIRRAVESAAVLEFARSGGPGGQNVNKVNTKATARVDLGALGLSEAELDLLRARLGSRLSEDRYLAVSASDTRSQLLNRELALERLSNLVAAALHRAPPRRPTAPTRASRERRLAGKRRASALKRDRRPDFGD